MMIVRLTLWLLLVVSALACEDSSSSGPGITAMPPPVPPTNPTLYAVRGTVAGLDGAKVTVLLNGGNATETGDGAFAFPASLAEGASYSVTAQAPAGLACSVAGGTGTIARADATGVAVTCASSDATLKTLTLSGGVLAPAFDPATLLYSARALATLSAPTAPSATITATTTHPGAQVTIAGVAATSGTPSAVLTLKLGPNPIDVVVTAPDGKKQARYTIAISGVNNDYIKASNTRTSGGFGDAVALSGDTLAVGAYGDSSNAKGINGDQLNTSAPYAGAVFVFRRSATGWAQEAYIKASNARPGASFGDCVALDGDTLAVGSGSESSNATTVNGDQLNTLAADAGAAYVFKRTGSTWVQEAYIKASNTRPNAAFAGNAIVLFGDRLAVGARDESSNATGVNNDETNTMSPGSGAAYVFKRTGSAWAQEAYVKASNTRDDASFGVSLALTDDTLAVGSYDESSGSNGINGNEADTSAASAGAVYVYRRTGTTWAQEAYVKASNPRMNASFGDAVALSGDTLAVGSSGESSNATNVNGNELDTSMSIAGAVYVFTRSGTAWSQQAYVKASNTRAGAGFGGSVALVGNTLAVGSSGESSNAKGVGGDQTNTMAANSGAVYILGRSGTTWSHKTYVKPSNTRANLRFDAVALSGDALAVGTFFDSSNAKGINGNQSDTSAANAGAVYAFGL